MARYRRTLPTPRSIDGALAHPRYFSTAEEWDPGVVETKRLDDGRVEDGSELQLLRVGDRALDGLRHKLSTPPSRATSAATASTR